MTVRRVMGIETEYGISLPGEPHANPMVLSGQVVNAYAAPLGHRVHRTRWDYADEAPLRDARGYDVSRTDADPSQLTDMDDPTLANIILTNGARLYVDHAHPEYSSPEVTSPRAAALWDKAGERIMATAVAALATTGVPINLYKNNTDGKGASYGTHENYLMRRSTPFADIVRHLVPFFVTRQVICGAGRVGIGPESKHPGYQISQRADFFEVEVGLETTLKRPIINTRDEPHATADKYRRLHVIVGDANLSEISTIVKMGTTSLVLAMIEDGALTRDLTLRRPVAALHTISHDPTLRTRIELRDGSMMTAVELQWAYLEQARAYLDTHYGGVPDDDTAEVLDRWESLLSRLENDPMQCVTELDWVAKWAVLQGFARREELLWDHPRMHLIDLQYTDVRPAKGLYHRLMNRHRMIRLLDDVSIATAMTNPPEDTRAYFRGRCLAKYGSQVSGASWDSLIFDIPGRESLQRIPMLEPTRGTRAAIGALIDASPTAEDLIDALASRG
ncbi:MAG: depupylase/deamidase Dop [Actinomycetota bacterium]